MRIELFLAALAVGCGGGGGDHPDGGTEVGGDFTTSELAFTGEGNGNLALAAYSGPLISVDGDHTIAAGVVQVDITPSMHANVRTLTALDADHVLFIERYEFAHPDVRTSSIVSDGARGAFVASTRLTIPSGYLSVPVITHFDANGAVAWSKAYEQPNNTSWTLPQQGGVSGVDTFPDGVLSRPVAGKLALIAGNAIMVIDGSGAVQWAKQYGGQPATELSQLYADADGITAWGVAYDSFVAIRVDWSGTLVSFHQAACKCAGATTFMPPHRRADGNLVLGYDTFDAVNMPISGVLVLDATGTSIVEELTYSVTALWDETTFDRPLTPATHIRFLADDVVTTHHTYMEGISSPYMTTPVDLAFAVGADGGVASITYSARSKGLWSRLGSGALLVLQSSSVGTGSLGAPCAKDAITISVLTKAASPGTFQPLVTATTAESTLTVTPVDEAVTVTDVGAVTATEIPSQTCQ
jgi:hypothetical protein